MALARYELALEFLADLQRIDTQMRDTKKRLELAVKASATTVTEVFGVGPYVAATVIGYVGDVSRFLDRDHFAAYNGTAPIEVSSGNHKIFRLSLRGKRWLNHARPYWLRGASFRSWVTQPEEVGLDMTVGKVRGSSIRQESSAA